MFTSLHFSLTYLLIGHKSLEDILCFQPVSLFVKGQGGDGVV